MKLGRKSTRHDAAALQADLTKRIEIRCDGKLILVTSIIKQPENRGEMIDLLKSLIELMESPDVPDLEFT
jgi:formyltetrahydrofolate synthetase